MEACKAGCAQAVLGGAVEVPVSQVSVLLDRIWLVETRPEAWEPEMERVGREAPIGRGAPAEEAEGRVSAGSRVCKAQRVGHPTCPEPWLLLQPSGHLGLPSLQEGEGPQWRLGPLPWRRGPLAWRRASLLFTPQWASRPFPCSLRPPSLEAHITFRAQSLCSSQSQVSPQPWALTACSPLPSDAPPASVLGDSLLCTQHPSGTRALSAGTGPPSLPQPPRSPALAPSLWPLVPSVLRLAQGPVTPTPPLFPHGSAHVVSTPGQEHGHPAHIFSLPAICGADLADQGPPDLGPLCLFGPHHTPAWDNPVPSLYLSCFRLHRWLRSWSVCRYV